MFDGTTSTPVQPVPIQGIFKGKTLENIASFTGVVAAVSENQYFISDLTNTIVYNIVNKTWRDLGVGSNALFFEKETGQMQATISAVTQLLEDEGALTDNGTTITFEAELPSVATAPDRKAVLRDIYIELDTTQQNITLTLILDGVSTTLPLLNTQGRETRQIKILRYGNIAGLRIEGSLTAKLFVYKVMFDVYLPTPQQEISNASVQSA